MAGDIRSKYTTKVDVTITLDALADGAARQSAKVDNTSALELDGVLSVKLVAGTPVSGDKKALIYAYGCSDDTNFTGGATGSDGAYTMEDPSNLKFVGEINTPTNSGTYRGTFSVAAAFGGILPKQWGIVVVNKTGAALGASCTVDAQGMKLAYT